MRPVDARGATPRAEVSDAAQTFLRGRGGGPGRFRGARRGGFRGVGHDEDLAPFPGQWSEQGSLAPRRGG